MGTEVKSIRSHHISLDAAFVIVESNEMIMINCNIDPFSNSDNNHEPQRKRKLLLNKNQIVKWNNIVKSKGFTIVPTCCYIKNNLIKIEIALCRGKKLHDKRESMKEKESQKEMK